MRSLARIKRYIGGLIDLYGIREAQFRRDELLLRETFYSPQQPWHNTPRAVVCMIDGKAIHGGFTDRIRGMVSAYAYCKAHGLEFRIHHNFPFPLTDYLVPNQYDWRISQEELCFNSEQAAPVSLFDYRLPGTLHQRYLGRELKKGYRQIHLYTNSYFADGQFTELFAELFKPSAALQDAIDRQAAMLPVTYTAMVFRFQQLLGDFKESGYATLDPDQRKELIRHCLDKVESLRAQNPAMEHILITSDSCTFLEEAAKLPFVHTIPGTVVHMDHTADASFQTYLKSFVDFFILSRGSEIILMQTGQMYHSGFGRRAAMVCGIPYREIVF